ncbi:hypothetical protein T02_4946 [Trichinella nativa]|uniref:Uncharacterized protein n=1 Tax=Trichinella nativa TaxID=6335 RepID=A0A0V1L271_9BILA|nr:hypothetical protein T02_4946 [Trichinella nativa]
MDDAVVYCNITAVFIIKQPAVMVHPSRSQNLFGRISIKRQLKPFHPLLKHFRGHTVQVLGAAFLTVEYGFFNRPLNALVVKGRRYSLLGRNWFEPLDIRLVRMHNVMPNSIENLIEEYAELFSSTLDTVKGPPVVLHIGGSVPPIQKSARRVPLALGFAYLWNWSV